MSQTACGYSLSGLWKMNKKQSIPMLFAALQEVGDLQRQIRELKLERQRDTIAEVRSARDRAISQNKKLKEENKKLKEEVEHCQGIMEGDEDLEERLKAQHQIDIECFQEDIKKLKEELEEKEEEVSLINSEEMENEEKIALLEEENKKLKEENEKIKDEACDYESMRKHRDTLLEESEERFMEIVKLKELKDEYDGWKASYDDDIREAKGEKQQEIDELKEENEELKAKFEKFKQILTQE